MVKMADPMILKRFKAMVTNDMNTFAYHGSEVEILEMNTAVVWWQAETFELPTNLGMSRSAHCHNPS